MFVKSSDLRERLRGVLLGTAVGDALGLPAEGLSARRIKKFYSGHWKHRFLFRRGMISDDTEHTILVAQSLLTHPDSVSSFTRALAWKFRFWLLGLPAGIGWATLRGILKLWCGVPPEKSGVISAGNGPVMRSAIIGVFFAQYPEKRDACVAASTRLTHTDPRAATGARAVAALGAWSVCQPLGTSPDFEEVFEILQRAEFEKDREWPGILLQIRLAYGKKLSVAEFAFQLGVDKRVSGYVYHTVPVAIYAWLVHYGDFERTLTSVLDCGGDTDTAGAITAALAGAAVGEDGIRPDWIDGIWDWPRGPSFLRRLGDRLAEGSRSEIPTGPVRYFWPALIIRNTLFMAVVLIHGLRRLFPPY